MRVAAEGAGSPRPEGARAGPRSRSAASPQRFGGQRRRRHLGGAVPGAAALAERRVRSGQRSLAHGNYTMKDLRCSLGIVDGEE
ncbi:unnamed protein product [Coccothraustes coccothraustes]